MRNDVLETEKIAFVAGVFDGEGCVAIKEIKDNDYPDYICYALAIAIGITNHNLTDWLQNTFGGKVYETDCSKRGRKDVFTWRLYGDNAYLFLQKIYRYSIIKKEQIEVAFSFMNKDYCDKGETFFLRMKELNKRGI